MNANFIPFDKERLGFDFDGTLEKTIYQSIAYYLKSLNKELFIITKRNKEQSKEVFQIANKLNIPLNNCIFTNNGPKGQIICNNKIQVFFDDTKANLDEINMTCPSCITLLAD